MLNLSNHSSVVIGVEAAPVIQILDLFNPNPFLIKFVLQSDDTQYPAY